MPFEKNVGLVGPQFITRLGIGGTMDGGQKQGSRGWAWNWELIAFFLWPTTPCPPAWKMEHRTNPRCLDWHLPFPQIYNVEMIMMMCTFSCQFSPTQKRSVCTSLRTFISSQLSPAILLSPTFLAIAIMLACNLTERATRKSCDRTIEPGMLALPLKKKYCFPSSKLHNAL